MALTIYGSARSRTMRTLWTAAELGLSYTHIPLAFDDPALKAAPFLRVNPAGSVPAIVDGDFALPESLAINLYLTKKYGRGGAEPLYPATVEGEAEVWRWTLWAQGHLEQWLQQDRAVRELLSTAGDGPARLVAKAMAVLETALASGQWLAASHFSVADLNVAAVLSPSRAAHVDFTNYPSAREWLTRCYARPAAIAARQQASEM